MRKRSNDTLVEEIRPERELTGKVNHPISKEALEAIIENRNTKILNVTVASYDPQNIADALVQCPPEDILFFFKSVNPDESAEVFTALPQEKKEEVVQDYSSDDLQKLIEPMQTDDLVDFVDELPANLVSKVLKATPPEDRQRIFLYLNFKNDSAGTIMTPEFLYVRDTDSVQDALKELKEHGKDKETVWEVIVVDKTRTLVGTVTLDRLLESDPHDVIKSVMDDNYVYVTTDTDEEVVIQAFRKYDISVLPVTNRQRRPLGIITFDDVMDVASTENTEDIQLQSGTLPSEKPYLKRSVFDLIKSYSIWLVVLLFLDTFISMALSYMDAPLAVVPLLISFLSPVMGTNSNAADQTTTIVIREMALGNINAKNFWKVVRKEFQTAVYTGIMLGLFVFGWTLVELYTGMVQPVSKDLSVIQNLYGGNVHLFYLSISAIRGLSNLAVILFAKVIGVVVPFLAKKLHIDPAVISQPFISTILDIVSIAVYFLFATLLMRGLGTI